MFPVLPTGFDGIFLTGDDGLQLTVSSLCIDAADGDEAPDTDVLGFVHVDITGVGTGTGNPPYVDIGPYEYDADTAPPDPDPATR